MAVLILAVFLILILILIAPKSIQPFLLKSARAWTAGLFCFFAGIHRGASFYAPEGPPLSDLLIFLSLHFGGLGLALLPPRMAWRIAPACMLLTLAGDVFLARQGRLPRFFLRFRALQLLTATTLIVLLGSTSGTHET